MLVRVLTYKSVCQWPEPPPRQTSPCCTRRVKRRPKASRPSPWWDTPVQPAALPGLTVGQGTQRPAKLCLTAKLYIFFGLYDGGGNNTRILEYQLFELRIAHLSAYPRTGERAVAAILRANHTGVPDGIMPARWGGVGDGGTGYQQKS